MELAAHADGEVASLIVPNCGRMGAEGIEWHKRPPVLVSGMDDDSPKEAR